MAEAPCRAALASEAMGWVGFEVDDVGGAAVGRSTASSSTPRAASRPG